MGKYLLQIMVEEGERFIILRDADLWGLRDALQHGIDDGYFKENLEWAQRMVVCLNSLREQIDA